MKVFVDTFAMIALLSSGDSAHAAVSDYFQRYKGSFVTTEWVLMELADAFAKARTRSIVVEFMAEVRRDPRYEVLGYDMGVYQCGLSLYVTHKDKDWSLTDCISFAVMESRNIQAALTGDKHFSQAGYEAVFAG